MLGTFPSIKKKLLQKVIFGGRIILNYIESNCDRNKTLSVEEYLYKIVPQLKDIINHLTKFNTWKVQLTIAINLKAWTWDWNAFNSDNKVKSSLIMTQMKLLKNVLNHFTLGIKLDWKHQWEVVVLSLIVSTYCIINIIRKFNRAGSYIDSPDRIKNKKSSNKSYQIINAFNML